jgi:hypothetical protein
MELFILGCVGILLMAANIFLFNSDGTSKFIDEEID